MVHKPIITHFLPIYECKPLTRVVCLFTSVGNAEISLSAEVGFVVVCRVYQNTGFLKSHSGLLFPALFLTVTKDWGREVYHLWYHCDTYCCLSTVWTLRGGVKVPCAVMSQATGATCTVAHITLYVHTEWLHENPYSSPGFSHTVELCVGSLPGDVCTGEPRDEPTVINHTAGYMHSTHNKFSKSVLSVHNRHTLNKHNHMRRVSAVRNPFTPISSLSTWVHTKLYRLGLNEAGDPFLLFLHEYIQNYTD